MRKFGAVALTCLVGLLAAGCGNDDDSGAASKGSSETTAKTAAGAPKTDGRGLVVGFSGLWNANVGVKLVQDALAEAVEARGAKLKLLQADAKDPVNTLISNMDQLTSQQVKAVAFYPIDPNALTAPTKRALAAEIPVASYELSKGPANVQLHQGREYAAITAAEAVCKKLPDGGKIVYGAYGQPDPTLNSYRKNFTEALAQCSKGAITIASVFENKTDDVAGAIQPALASLQRVPDAKAIVAYSDVTAIGASRAASQLGKRDQLTIFGYALAPQGVDAIRKGIMDYSFPSPVSMSQYLGNALVDLALGKKVPRFTTIWVKCYGKANVDEMPTPEEQFTKIRNGESLLDPAKDFATSDSEPVLTPKTPLEGCPV